MSLLFTGRELPDDKINGVRLRPFDRARAAVVCDDPIHSIQLLMSANDPECFVRPDDPETQTHVQKPASAITPMIRPSILQDFAFVKAPLVYFHRPALSSRSVFLSVHRL
jgi:hypothetical protein